MDDRLKEVHQTEIAESRINEEFVEWLKTKGPQYVLLGLIGVCLYLGVVRWKQHRTNYFNDAWTEYVECRLPGSYEDVAARYADVPWLSEQALRAAGDAWLLAVQRGKALGADAPGVNTPALSELQRLDYLDKAAALYHALANGDDGSLAMTLYAVSAMQGLAVVAESKGQIDEASRWYDMAAARAEEFYPDLARRVRDRASTVGEYTEPVTLPTQAELPAPATPAVRTPVSIEQSLRELLLPDEPGAG